VKNHKTKCARLVSTAAASVLTLLFLCGPAQAVGSADDKAINPSAPVAPTAPSSTQQDMPSSTKGGQFGLSAQPSTIYAAAFQNTLFNTSGSTWEYFVNGWWFLNGTTGTEWLEANIDLPDGAWIYGYRIYYYDADATYDITSRINKFVTDVNNPDTGYTWEIGAASSGSAGYGSSFATLANPIVVNHANQALALRLEVPGAAGSNLRFRAVRLAWFRNMSPAPGVATFSDVPVSHPFFQQVEALAASGVTLGCGGGNYCPDNAVTRGQMAAFLARALGLHNYTFF